MEKGKIVLIVLFILLCGVSLSYGQKITVVVPKLSDLVATAKVIIKAKVISVDSYINSQDKDKMEDDIVLSVENVLLGNVEFNTIKTRLSLPKPPDEGELNNPNTMSDFFSSLGSLGSSEIKVQVGNTYLFLLASEIKDNNLPNEILSIQPTIKEEEITQLIKNKISSLIPK